MLFAILPKLLLSLLALIGVVALVLGAMLASPLRAPPPLASIQAGAKAVGSEGKPDISRFQARDGTWLAYRLYPPAGGATGRLAIVVHGSTGSSDAMHAVAQALAAAGVTAVAIDARGHGASGTRGDIGYIGQLDDDLADLMALLRQHYPGARVTLIGHSSGGGFALRVAAGPLGASFDRIVVLAPYLGYDAPTNQASQGVGRWASPDMPRIIALSILRRLGMDWAQGLPAIAFANAPEAAKFVTSRYSYRLLVNFGPPSDWKGALQSNAGKIELIAGDADELMDPTAYQANVAPLGVRVTLLPGVDHMGILHAPAALAAIVAALSERPLR